MSKIIELSKTSSKGQYVLVTDGGTFAIKGDPTTAALEIQNIAGIVANFLLKEDDDFLLLENDSKIIL